MTTASQIKYALTNTEYNNDTSYPTYHIEKEKENLKKK